MTSPCSTFITNNLCFQCLDKVLSVSASSKTVWLVCMFVCICIHVQEFCLRRFSLRNQTFDKQTIIHSFQWKKYNCAHILGLSDNGRNPVVPRSDTRSRSGWSWGCHDKLLWTGTCSLADNCMALMQRHHRWPFAQWHDGTEEWELLHSRSFVE